MRAFPLLLCCAAFALAPLPAQVVIFGPTSRAEFEAFATNFGTHFVDFESVPTGALSTGLQAALGVTFASTISTGGAPMDPPHHAYVSTASIGGNATRKLVGTPSVFGADDGRVGYTISFDSPQTHAGLLRIWQANFSVTRFYNSAGALLASHTNTANIEFVGWLADPDDPSSWVSTIEVDGLSDLSLTRQVGYSDDLFFGTAPIPEPGSAALVFIGLLWLAWRCRSRALGAHQV